MLTHFYCLEKWKRYTSPMYPMANELTCLDFSYFRLYVTFPQSQQELISNTPAVQFRYLAHFLLQCIPDYHKSIRRRNNYSGFKM